MYLTNQMSIRLEIAIVFIYVIGFKKRSPPACGLLGEVLAVWAVRRGASCVG